MILFLFLAIVLAMGVPIGISLGVASVAGIAVIGSYQLELIAQSAGVIGHAVQRDDVQNFFRFKIVIIAYGFDGQASVIDVFDADGACVEVGKILLFGILL